ncbi:MAG TPA: hypothetical protein VKX17_19555 [Planctomycetota bacterium]|nr:hypothetical protein [Planctomycetota bacterium]
MRYFCLSVLCGALLLASAADKSPEEIVKAEITQFYAVFAGNDAEAQKKALDAMLPDEKTLEKLFGADAKLIWPDVEKYLKETRSHLKELREELTKHGAIKKIKLTDCRTLDEYKNVFKMIPKDIPVFDEYIEFENGAAGNGSYVVIDGKVKIFQGLDQTPEELAKRKAEKK